MKEKARYTRKIRIVKIGNRYIAERRVFFFFWEPAIYVGGKSVYQDSIEECERDIANLYIKEVVKVLN